MTASSWLIHNAYRLATRQGLAVNSTNAMKVMLFPASATAVHYATVDTYASISALELGTGSGYTNGGKAIVTTWALVSGNATLDYTSYSFAVVTATLSAGYAAIVNISTTNNLIVGTCLLDVTNGSLVAGVGQTFVIEAADAGVYVSYWSSVAP